jgi:hypothetical protein
LFVWISLSPLMFLRRAFVVRERLRWTCLAYEA